MGGVRARSTGCREAFDRESTDGTQRWLARAAAAGTRVEIRWDYALVAVLTNRGEGEGLAREGAGSRCRRRRWAEVVLKQLGSFAYQS